MQEPAPAPAPAPVVQEPTPAPAAERSPSPAAHDTAQTPSADNDLVYINIMQTLVEAMAPRYIKMFGVCTCSRCAADVKALTLTNLAPKYAVFHKRDRIPMVTLYENRYGSTIATQLTKACTIVRINPHHR